MPRPLFITCPAAMWVLALASSGCILAACGNFVPMPVLVFAPTIAAGLGHGIARYYGPTCDIFPDHLGGRILLYPLGFVLAPMFWFPVRAVLAHDLAFASFVAIPIPSVAAFLYLHLREDDASPALPRPAAIVLRHVIALPVYVLTLAATVAAILFAYSLFRPGK